MLDSQWEVPDVQRIEAYPMRLDARPDPGLTHWLWLLKWILVIPHAILLAFLWLAFFVLTAVSRVLMTTHPSGSTSAVTGDICGLPSAR